MMRPRSKTNTMKALDLLCVNETVHYDGMVQIEADLHGSRPGPNEVIATHQLMCPGNVKATRKEHPLWARPMKQAMELSLLNDNLVLRAPSCTARGDGSDLILTVSVQKMGCAGAVNNIVYVICKRGNTHDNKYASHAFRLAKGRDAALLAEALDAVCNRFFGSQSPPRDRRSLPEDEQEATAPASQVSSAPLSPVSDSVSLGSLSSTNSSTKSSRSMSESDEAGGSPLAPSSNVRGIVLSKESDSPFAACTLTDAMPSVRDAKRCIKSAGAGAGAGPGADKKKALSAQSWFHGLISREEAEDRIEGQKVGTYLVRVSQSSLGYAVTLKDVSKEVRHFRVILDQVDQTLFLDGHKKYRFNSLPELIDHYYDHPVTIEGDYLLYALENASF